MSKNALYIAGKDPDRSYGEMHCKNHPDNQAEFICSRCLEPLCRDCVIEGDEGKTFCRLCFMCYTVSKVDSLIKEEMDRIGEKNGQKKEQWSPFRCFMILSQVLILIMLIVIFFAG